MTTLSGRVTTLEIFEQQIERAARKVTPVGSTLEVESGEDPEVNQGTIRVEIRVGSNSTRSQTERSPRRKGGTPNSLLVDAFCASMVIAGVRPEVQEFAVRMEKKLRRDDGSKAHWDRCDFVWLLKRLLQEAEELEEAIQDDSPQEIVKEAADVANFAMMISDNAGKLIK